MTIIIDADTAVELLKAAVAERGEDYEYMPPDRGKCLYWHTDEDAPGCGVGLALVKVGVSADSLIDIDEGYTSGADRLPSHELQTDSGEHVQVSEDAARIFSNFQFYQDGGSSWGESLKFAGIREV